MKHHRIELLIALVLFAVALAAAWTPSRVDARGFVSLNASSALSADKPGASIASGDPDLGQGGATPPPPPQVKNTKRLMGNWDVPGHGLIGWVRWTSRIWATLYLRTAQ
jgi:hypothetical protein